MLRVSNDTTVPWHGLALNVLNSRPFIRSFVRWGFPLALTGYCGFIGLANSLRWPWLEWWLNFWEPVVRTIRGLIPVFDNSAAALTMKGFESRIEIIHHLLAIGWLAAIAAFVFLISKLADFSDDEWRRYIKIVSKRRLILLLFGFGALFGVELYWATIGFGFGSEFKYFAFHRHDFLLTVIGMNFCGLAIFGFGFFMSLQGIIFEKRLGSGNDSPSDPLDRTL